jgi:small GTP-binding protein
MEQPLKMRGLHIVIAGRRNVGKSSLINLIANQDLTAVNGKPGTTTNPLSQAVELSPYGPVVIIDTAGIDGHDNFRDDETNSTKKAFSLADFTIILLDARVALNKSETDLITFLRKKQIPFLIAVNKIEYGLNPYLLIEIEALELTHFEISCKENAGIENFKKKLIHMLPNKKETRSQQDPSSHRLGQNRS